MKKMKIIYLIPPSEWKTSFWEFNNEKLSFIFDKPLNIAKNVTEKDLKCIWNRYLEWITLNKNITIWPFLKAIERYNWVMYNAIDYKNMTKKSKSYFDENFLILSWMYWVLKPSDVIWNYKLPIETKWLLDFWWDKITNLLNNLDIDLIIDFLPNSYKKMINKKILTKKIIEIDFLTHKNWKITKISHWVKKIKWEFIKDLRGKDLDLSKNKIEIIVK